jgi:hypothetical protein
VETAVVRFNARHPYLLFDEHAIPWVCGRANSQTKLITRLKTSLSEVGSRSTKQELRARIKRQARCLIHTAFLALISDGETKADALYATRTALAQLSAEPSWKARPVIKSFLDCAEIAVAVSLAYDWLYHEFSDQERRMFENSLSAMSSRRPLPHTRTASRNGRGGATTARWCRIRAFWFRHSQFSIDTRIFHGS